MQYSLIKNQRSIKISQNKKKAFELLKKEFFSENTTQKHLCQGFLGYVKQVSTTSELTSCLVALHLFKKTINALSEKQDLIDKLVQIYDTESLALDVAVDLLEKK